MRLDATVMLAWGKNMGDYEENYFQTFAMVLGGLMLFTIVVMLIARAVGIDQNSGPMTDRDIDERTRPYGQVKVASVSEVTVDVVRTSDLPGLDKTTTPIESSKTSEGQHLYNDACIACHGTGVAGAPIVGNAEAWKDRIKAGVDTLVVNAVHGKGVMPPKGNRVDFNKQQIRAIVEYMVSVSK